MTDADRHLMTIFSGALDRESPPERAAYLDEACAADAALRERVEALLRAHEQAGGFLEPRGTAAFESSSAPSTTPNPVAGTIIADRYKLIEEIGEGGMGTVWMAQQTEPVKRAVAVKLIKAGMDSKQVLARFEAERQALALMDHPNIAKVLDGGMTGEPGALVIGGGRPFFVMELVKGVPITKYCDEHRLTPRQRLDLFVPVCQAVQHAHQKGIIHRDIKPSNILVTQYDGRPVPKVIDFGVAKAAGQQLTDKTLMTGFGAVVGTLEYMSPEQAELNQLDIDTRSDIYSLGVVLYELLTGSTPLDKKRLKQAAFAEILRVIREEEPPKPSTRLSNSTDSLPSVSAQRHMEPAKLTKLVRGELDWIVMKALEKDRSRRYETANGFAMDIQRYLADEPVQACPPSTAYRFRKFARRNKGPVVAVSLVLLTLVAGIVGTSLGLVRANRAREAEAARAEGERKAKDAESAQRRRAEENAALAFGVLDDIILDARERVNLSRQDAAKGLARNPELEQLERGLLKKSVALYEKLAQANATDWPTRRQQARSTVRVAYLQRYLNNYGESEKAYGRAIHLMGELAREKPDDFDNAFQLAETSLWFYLTFWESGRFEACEKIIRRALALFDKLAADFPDRPVVQEHRAYCRRNLAQVLKKAGRLMEAEKAFEDSIAVWAELVAAHPKHPGYRNALAHDYGSLGELYHQTDRMAKAIDLWRQAALLLEKVVAESNNPDFRWLFAGSLERLGCALAETDQPQEAEKYDRAALSVWEKLAAQTDATDHHFHLALSHQQLGQHLKKTGQHPEAINAYRAATPVWEKLVARSPKVADYRQHLSRNYGWLAEALVELGDHVEAAKTAEKLPAALPDHGQGQTKAVPYLIRCAQVAEKDSRLPETGRKAVAQAYLDAAKELLRQVPEQFPNDPAALNNCAWQLAVGPEPRLRDPRQAVDLAKRAVDLAPKNGTFWNTLGAAQYRAGDWKAAIAALDKSMELRKGGDSFDWFFLAMARWQLGDKEKARTWFDKAVQWMDKNQPKNEELSHFRAEAAELLGIKDGKK
jgi:serine/threonine protein kinase/tetratricopeptide (TPR) repeat protein